MRGFFEEELRYLNHAMCKAVTVAPGPIIDCFHMFDQTRAQMVLSLLPGSSPYACRIGDMVHTRQVVGEYDEKVLVPMLLNSIANFASRYWSVRQSRCSESTSGDNSSVQCDTSFRTALNSHGLFDT